MKKKIALTLLTAIVCLFAFTGCKEDKPYSIYQIGTSFSGIDISLTPEEIEALPTIEKEKLAVANSLASWLINSRFIMNGTLGNPIVIEGSNEEYNDEQAIRLYNNNVVLLNDKDLKQVIIDAQKKVKPDGKRELTLTIPGTITFNYMMWKGSAVSLMTECQESYTVSYGPLSETTNP